MTVPDKNRLPKTGSTRKKRVSRRQIQLPFSSNLVITARKFKTKPARRSKSRFQLVVPVYFLPYKEIAISAARQKSRLRRTGFIGFVKKASPKELQRKHGASILLIAMGITGAIYFGLSLNQPVKLEPVSTNPIPTQVVAPPPQPDLPKTLSRSEPTRVRINKLQIDTSIIGLGRKSDGSMQVPAQPNVTGWYTLAPTPGELGPAIIVGHVDSPKGPAIFWRLRELQAGDMIDIDRADGTTAKFVVNVVKQYEQNNFPTAEVYGNINHAGIRLITCGGVFDRQTRHYSHNTVVFGTLVN